MKNKIWLYQLPLIFLFAFLYWVSEAGVQGNLNSPFLRENVFPALRSVHGWFTNRKFLLRGQENFGTENEPRYHRNNIVIVEIDDQSIATYGRFPWHRDRIADLVDKLAQRGAKVMGIDIVFSEPDVRVSEKTLQELARFYKNPAQLQAKINELETDEILRFFLELHSDKTVLGYMIPGKCQPAYTSPELCPVTDPRALAGFPQGFEKFAMLPEKLPPDFKPAETPLISAWEVLPNLPMYSQAAQHAGYLDVEPDRDGFIRRINLVHLIGQRAYPSVALSMAAAGLGEKIQVSLDKKNRIFDLRFANSGRTIPVSPLGVMEMNFRGPARTFPYISVRDVLEAPLDDATIERISLEQAEGNAETAKAIALEHRTARDQAQKVLAQLKDAYVLIGVSAAGLYDMRAFPYDSQTPGVEGHATILDNLLSGDMLHYGSSQQGRWVLFLLMTVGAALFAWGLERLESVPALLLFVGVGLIGGLIDVKVLFQGKHMNLNTSLLVLELGTLFLVTLAVKYVLEERNKKFIKGAFSKYVAPTIVDSILKDPTKLTVGGEKKELSIMFSDIRSFTTFSERMDAKALAGFLNDYLGLMTDIVFECDGTLDKYIGDAVMAFWGAPLDQPHHAANACRAAIAMQRKIDEHFERFKTQYGVEVAVGIGINSGAVNVGNMGSERIFEYTVIGDHVNLASRLEGLTKYYGVKIVTTRFTMDMITQSNQPLPPHRVLDFVKVKGKKKAVELLQVLERDFDARALALFEEARQLYTQQKWDEAISRFQEASPLLSYRSGEPDSTCLMYIERCEEMKKTPPAPDWDGSWEMHSK